jgi:methionyl-tRNA formyltransferase/LmbE family N-acetylglucosaminyl deacetylase
MESSHEMSMKRRVVFIGGLDDGHRAVEILLKLPGTEFVGAFVLDEEAGQKVSGFRTFDDLFQAPSLHKVKRIKNHVEEIADLKPDIIFIIGFSQIIPQSILDIPPMGVIGFHSAVLPGRRGCSPLIWAMVDGLKEAGMTMFYMDAGIDTGDVIATRSFPIEESDYAADILKKADDAMVELLRENLPLLVDGRAPRTRQDDSLCTYTRKRTPADGEIDWGKPAKDIVNLIRALSPPYPMAHTFDGDGVPILVERAYVAPGLVLPPPRFPMQDPLRQRVLCVVAHPDDEVLGIGGTLALHAEAGSEVVVVILSEGEAEKSRETPKNSTRRQCALKAAEILGYEKVIFHDFPDQRLEQAPFLDIIKAVESAVKNLRPTVIYTHHIGDANTDHHVAHRAALAACRPMSELGACVNRFLAFETPSSTDQAPQIAGASFAPTSYVDIGPVWEKKLKALEAYPTEIIGGRHPRSYEYIEALARMRGGHAGYQMAEGFMLLRERLHRPV